MSTLRNVCVLLALAGAMATLVRAEGPRLSLVISADVTETYLGEPLPIHVQVKNVSKQDVQLPVTWEAGYFEGTITREGHSGKWDFRIPGAYIGRIRVETLKPGQTYERWTDLVGIALHQRAGTYVLDGKFVSDGAAPDRIKGTTVPCWKGTVAAKPLKITVKEPPTKEDREALKLLSAKYGGPEKCLKYEDIWIVFIGEIGKKGPDNRFARVLKEYPKSVYAPYCRLALAQFLYEVHDGLGDGYATSVGYLAGLIRMTRGFHVTDKAELLLGKWHVKEAKYARKATDEERRVLRDKGVSVLKRVSRTYPTRRAGAEAKRLLVSMRIGSAQTRPSGSGQKGGAEEAQTQPSGSARRSKGP